MEPTTQQQPTTDQEIALINEWIPEIQKAGTILIKHKTRTSGAENRGRAIIKAIEANGGKMTPELDAKCQAFLADCTKAKAEMELARKPVTSLAQQITALYTREEKKLDTTAGAIPLTIQGMRNTYVRQLKDEEEKRKQEAEQKAAKEQEAIRITQHTNTQIGFEVSEFLRIKKSNTLNSFNAITLADFDAKAEAIKTWIPELTNAAIEKMKIKVHEAQSKPICQYHNNAEATMLVEAAIAAHDWNMDKKVFINELSELRTSLIDRLPSLKQEMQDLAKALQENDANERIRLQNQKAQRELEEQQRLDQEAKDQAEQNRKAAETKADGDRAMSLFNQSISTATPIATMPAARSGWNIDVKHQAGWVLIFNFWYEREGVKCAPADMGKTTLGQMKKFAEKIMKDKREKIESSHLVYTTTDKAINARQKPD